MYFHSCLWHRNMAVLWPAELGGTGPAGIRTGDFRCDRGSIFQLRNSDSPWSLEHVSSAHAGTVRTIPIKELTTSWKNSNRLESYHLFCECICYAPHLIIPTFMTLFPPYTVQFFRIENLIGKIWPCLAVGKHRPISIRKSLPLMKSCRNTIHSNT
jgi:hypothetical protein